MSGATVFHGDVLAALRATLDHDQQILLTAVLDRERYIVGQLKEDYRRQRRLAEYYGRRQGIVFADSRIAISVNKGVLTAEHF